MSNWNAVLTTVVGGLLGVMALGALTTVGFAVPIGDVAHGETVYEKCMGCHSLDANRVGPMHRGVFGRVAGGVEGYRYSSALRNSGITWNEETLDAWLTDPGKFIRGSAMGFRLSDAQDRADVIAYLQSVGDD